MRILIESCPNLELSRIRRIFSMSCSVNVTFDKDLFVLKKIVVGISLLSFITERCLAKKELNSSALRLKSVMKIFSWKSGEIHGVFYYSRKV